MRAVKLALWQNPPVLNWRCRLTEAGLHNGHKPIAVLKMCRVVKLISLLRQMSGEGSSRSRVPRRDVSWWQNQLHRRPIGSARCAAQSLQHCSPVWRQRREYHTSQLFITNWLHEWQQWVRKGRCLCLEPTSENFVASGYTHIHTHTHVHPFNGPFSLTTRVSWYQKGKPSLDFTEARDSEWQWHRLGHMQVCTSLQTDNHASTPPLRFLQARCPSCRPSTNSVKALKAKVSNQLENLVADG